MYDTYDVHMAHSGLLDEHNATVRLPSRDIIDETKVLTYRLRDIVLRGHTFYDFVFPCLTRNYKTAAWIIFYVSRVYSDHYRFVLRVNDEQKMVPIAVAYDAAWIDDELTITESDYQKMKKLDCEYRHSTIICNLPTSCDRDGSIPSNNL